MTTFPPARLDPAPPGQLRVLARADWPEGAVPPPLPGFVRSAFSPLAAAVADVALAQLRAEPPIEPELGREMAIVIATQHGDVVTDAAIAAAVDQGRPVPPLLFFQSVPNAVAGHIARRWQLLGPVYCLVAAEDPEETAMRQIELLLAAGAARHALAVVVEPYPAAGPPRACALVVGPAAAPR